MKLITKQIEKAMPPLYSHDGKSPNDVPIIVKFFNPMGAGTWYITEGNLSDGTLFGLCSIQEPELGYVSLHELEGLRLPAGLGIERDLHLPKGFTLADAMKREGYNE
jgi:hypothetical protein